MVKPGVCIIVKLEDLCGKPQPPMLYGALQSAMGENFVHIGKL